MLFSNIEIKGHSGCSIEVIEQKKELLLTKSTHKPAYVSRLKKQAIKQKLFFSSEYNTIRTPKIIRIEESEKSCFITMQYIHAQNFVEFFDHAGFEKIDRFASQIIQFLDWEVKQSALVKIPDSVLSEKFESVKKNLHDSFPNQATVESIINRSQKAFEQLHSIELPVGQCHGDFTLSNILFNDNRLFLIDFLDSFIESPLMDMIKIRQDTAYAWSYLMYENVFDSTRHQITLEWIDEVLKNHFSIYEWYNNYYGAFQLMNFLRILQYAHQSDVIGYLIKKINLIFDNHEF